MACEPNRSTRPARFFAEELDLREYFDDAVWINGGNAFPLRRAMRQSGFDLVIRELLQADKIVYAGFSATACCAAAALRGAEMVDDPRKKPSLVAT
jgi:dipeptidase E